MCDDRNRWKCKDFSVRIFEKVLQSPRKKKSSVFLTWSRRFKIIVNAWYESIEKNEHGMPGVTSGIVFNEARLPNINLASQGLYLRTVLYLGKELGYEVGQIKAIILLKE